ncbi:hypothetical protein, partial [Citricoccus nitrophenolicus]|uniref:hypothetical protein n=1 Tax=Citricoccus nitrophenolicus TaxID=863575 RepID=UPI0031EAE4EA
APNASNRHWLSNPIRVALRTPNIHPRGINFDPQGPYAAIIAMKELLKSISGNQVWADEVDAHLDSSSTYSSGIYRPFAK